MKTKAETFGQRSWAPVVIPDTTGTAVITFSRCGADLPFVQRWPVLAWLIDIRQHATQDQPWARAQPITADGMPHHWSYDHKGALWMCSCLELSWNASTRIWRFNNWAFCTSLETARQQAATLFTDAVERLARENTAKARARRKEKAAREARRRARSAEPAQISA